MPNQIRIEGNLGKDSELRVTQSGRSVLNWSIAADQQSRKNEQGQWEQTGPTLWLDCEMWGDDVDALGRKLIRGTRAIVFGHVKCETWQDKQTGEQRFRNKVAVDAVKVVPPRNQGGYQQGQQTAQQSQGFGSQPQGGGFGADEPVPF